MSMSNTNKRIKEIRRKTRRKFSSEEWIVGCANRTGAFIAVIPIGFTP